MQSEKTNYDKKLKQLMGQISGKSVLLHSCCAACASHCLSVLLTKTVKLNFDEYSNLNKLSLCKSDNYNPFFVTAFFYNPCIMPKTEYVKRLKHLKALCKIFDTIVLEGDYDNEGYLQSIKGLEDCSEGGQRCEKCFFDRLMVTAKTAKEKGFNFFATSLTLSPHKNSALINKIGFEIQNEIGVQYLPTDFKKCGGYQHSLQLSKILNLYRQNYCGCIFSK